MGKALVFDGIVITEPLGDPVHFTDGLAQPVRTYIQNLSTSVTDAQKQAFQTFYETLNNAGLWDKITCLYPMWGNVADCSHGLIGEDITIPSGAIYDKGIDLTNATGGFGGAGKGILLLGGNTYPSSPTNGYSQFVNFPYKWEYVSGSVDRRAGHVLTFSNDDLRNNPNNYPNDDGRILGHVYGNNTTFMNLQFSRAGEAARVTAEDVDNGEFIGFFGESNAFGGDNLQQFSYYFKTENGQKTLHRKQAEETHTLVDKRGKLGINSNPHPEKDAHLMKIPVNMIIICDGFALSQSEVEILGNAVNALTSVIFA